LCIIQAKKRKRKHFLRKCVIIREHQKGIDVENEKRDMKMKKKVWTKAAMLLAAFATSLLCACGGKEVLPEEGTVTRMTVDVNPSVEFMVDDQNKVVSVTALNDDGSILIAGETFVGKTPEEAVELVVSLAAETGYLVKGNVTADENTVNISVSGDTEYAKQLAKDVETKAASVMESFDIEGKVAKIEAMNLEALRVLAGKTSLYTEEEIAGMDEKQLYAVLAESRIETALLLTEEMREAYYTAKEYEISFAESEAVAAIIGEMGGLYKLVQVTYQAALNTYSSAITALDDFRYDMLVSPDSDYQKTLTKLREAKTELLAQKNYVASLETDGNEYETAKEILQIREENYDKAVAAYEKMGEEINAALEKLISRLREAETAMKELEVSIFDDNIEAKLKEKAVEIETSLNEAKDNFFAEFEAAHADDIRTMEETLQAKKQEMKEAVLAAQK